MKKGFDTNKYIDAQLRAINDKIQDTKSRVYIEFGGKIIQDMHSARVLPGYDEDTKLQILKEIKQNHNGDVIFSVSGRDIDKGRIRGDFKITYDLETIRTINELKKRGLDIKHVAITIMDKEKSISSKIENLSNKLKRKGINVYYFYNLEGYDGRTFDCKLLSYNPFIELNDKKIIAVISPGSGSGKFGVCLSQLYHEMEREVTPHYLKFETFPVCDLPVEHPLNLSFMAASADFFDEVMVDKRDKKFTSYNRDLKNYELLKDIAAHFPKEGRYLKKINSATNMGVNKLSVGITDDEIVQKEAAAEIARRLIRYKFEVLSGKEDKKVLTRCKEVLEMLWKTN